MSCSIDSRKKITPQIADTRDVLCGVLVQFHQHATSYDVESKTQRLPNAVHISVDGACATPILPPSILLVVGTVAGRHVVVVMCSGKHHPVGGPVGSLWSRHGVAGVTAVPVHRQLILANLITDGERRVLGRVPQTVSTMDLCTTISCQRYCMNESIRLIEI